MADPTVASTAAQEGALATLAARDLRAEWGLRPIINASGTMTVLGASIMVPEAIAAMVAMAGQFVEIEALHRVAGEVIAELTGGEAGFVTASCASAITLSVAAAMTGDRLLAIERLPDTTGLRREVLVQLGHLVGYGASLQQTIELSGARVLPVGTISGSRDYQLEQAIGPQTACAVFVVSHMTVQHGLLGLEAFCRICHAQGVPVIVDAASEYDLRGFLQRGADLVTYSGHKFLGGPTSGIVTGRRDLVRAAALQNRGIGRGMKVGKESLAGLIGALRAWQRRDDAAVRRREDEALGLWQQALQGRPGLQVQILPDPTGNPLSRLRVMVRPDSGWTARRLADALAAGQPPVMVRDYQTDLGFFDLDPCNLHAGEAQQVAAQLQHCLALPTPQPGCPGQMDVLK